MGLDGVRRAVEAAAVAVGEDWVVAMREGVDGGGCDAPYDGWSVK